VTIQVTLDVFSGRQNPQWNLTDQEEASVLDALASLPRHPDPTAETDPPLGYRGVRVDVTRSSGSDHYTLYGTVVHSGTTPLFDESRRLERFLLRTGLVHADAALLRELLTDLTDPP